jgi:hypothetical protein
VILPDVMVLIPVAGFALSQVGVLSVQAVDCAHSSGAVPIALMLQAFKLNVAGCFVPLLLGSLHRQQVHA